MSETYRLLYYNCRGVGEPIRFIFAVTGVPYDDVRIHAEHLIPPSRLLRRPLPIPAEWEDRIPYGKVPVLEIEKDGEVRNIVSSKPICRYLASKYGLIAEDPFEDSKCDEYMDSLTDYTGLLRPIYSCEDKERQAQLLAELHRTQTPRYLGSLEQTVVANGTGYLVGKKLTWADIYLAHVLDNFSQGLDNDLLKNYPALAKLVNSVLSIPAIKDWIQVRPPSRW